MEAQMHDHITKWFAPPAEWCYVGRSRACKMLLSAGGSETQNNHPSVDKFYVDVGIPSPDIFLDSDDNYINK